MTRLKPIRAYAYLRLSVDKEDGTPQSIQAQRSSIRDYARKNGITIVEEFADAGFSGQNDRRPEFRRMVAQATADDHPVDAVLMFMLSRMARSARLFFEVTGKLEDAGVEIISITENFGTGRGRRIGRAITAVINEEQALDAAILTRKSRRENARQGFYNGGPIPFGYETYVARTDGEKERKKLAIVPDESQIVKRIFEWADSGRGGRWIVRALNDSAYSLRGARFTNGNIAGILANEAYTGTYHDRTADDDGVRPDIEDAIPVACPAIISREQFDRVASTRASRNPRAMAPHVAAGTTLLTGLARCGGPGCTSGLTIATGKGGRYAYYRCNDRLNRGGNCSTRPIRREELDNIVIDAIERRVLAPERLRELLAGVLDLSAERHLARQTELRHLRAEKTRTETAMNKLLILVEDEIMSPRDPVFAGRMAENKARFASVSARIDVVEAQLVRGARQIDEHTVAKFGELLAAKLRDDDPTLRAAYLKLFVAEVRVSDSLIEITGPTVALEAGVATGIPVKAGVPSFDREWCRLQDTDARS